MQWRLALFVAGVVGVSGWLQAEEPTLSVQHSDWRMARVIRFDGVDDYVRAGDDASLRPECFTLSVWVKAGKLDGQQPLLAKAQSAGNWCSYMLRMEHGGSISLAVENSEAERTAHWQTRKTLTAGAWRHIAATWSCTRGDASDAKIYLDGVEQELDMTLNRGYDATFRIGYSSEPLYLGRDEFPTGLFKGTLAHADVIPSVLAAEEIKAITDQGTEE